MNDFTKGKYYKGNENDACCEVCIGVDDYVLTVSFDREDSYHAGAIISRDEMNANADLYATAGTTATKLAEAGYDAQKVLEVLPELVANAEVGSVARVYELLEQCRCE